jgi:hypothetical protein
MEAQHAAARRAGQEAVLRKRGWTRNTIPPFLEAALQAGVAPSLVIPADLDEPLELLNPPKRQKQQRPHERQVREVLLLAGFMHV